jgi:hypothetical protein
MCIYIYLYECILIHFGYNETGPGWYISRKIIAFWQQVCKYFLQSTLLAQFFCVENFSHFYNLSVKYIRNRQLIDLLRM